jgi:hypothetical protein
MSLAHGKQGYRFCRASSVGCGTGDARPHFAQMIRD